jgi:hypothetical protein
MSAWEHWPDWEDCRVPRRTGPIGRELTEPANNTWQGFPDFDRGCPTKLHVCCSTSCRQDNQLQPGCRLGKTCLRRTRTRSPASFRFPEKSGCIQYLHIQAQLDHRLHLPKSLDIGNRFKAWFTATKQNPLTAQLSVNLRPSGCFWKSLFYCCMY